MIKVKHKRYNTYEVTIDMPESHFISLIATGYGMPKTTAIESCLHKGITKRMETIREIAAHEQSKRLAEGNTDDVNGGNH